MNPCRPSAGNPPGKRRFRLLAVLPGSVLAGLVGSLVVPCFATAAPSAPPGFTVSQFATAPAGASQPDDIAQLGNQVFVGWQNGVGPKGEPSSTGQTQSTIVAYGTDAKPTGQWSVTGKADGIGADPAHGRVIVTVNEDGNSSLYTITPSAPAGSQVKHYNYSPEPDSGKSGGVLTGGGTDAVTYQNGNIYLSASNPQAPNATAAFKADLDPAKGTATLSPTFADDASATNGVTGKPVTLALTDPDSNAAVPSNAQRFGGQFLLDSTGDQQLVFAAGLPGRPTLTQLPLHYSDGAPAGVDDVRFAPASTPSTLLVVDHGANTVYKVNGPFKSGQAEASLDDRGPKGRSSTQEVDNLSLSDGELRPFVTGLNTSKGLLFTSP